MQGFGCTPCNANEGVNNFNQNQVLSDCAINLDNGRSRTKTSFDWMVSQDDMSMGASLKLLGDILPLKNL